jgi:hypothetical protein
MGERTAQQSGKLVVYYTNGSPAHEIKCQITPEAQGKAFTDFGVEANNPHLMLCDPEWYDLIKKGNVGVHDGRQFMINADPQKWAAELTTSCVAVSLEEIK